MSSYAYFKLPQTSMNAKLLSSKAPIASHPNPSIRIVPDKSVTIIFSDGTSQEVKYTSPTGAAPACIPSDLTPLPAGWKICYDRKLRLNYTYGGQCAIWWHPVTFHCTQHEFDYKLEPGTLATPAVIKKQMPECLRANVMTAHRKWAARQKTPMPSPPHTAQAAQTAQATPVSQPKAAPITFQFASTPTLPVFTSYSSASSASTTPIPTQTRPLPANRSSRLPAFGHKQAGRPSQNRRQPFQFNSNASSLPTPLPTPSQPSVEQRSTDLPLPHPLAQKQQQQQTAAIPAISNHAPLQCQQQQTQSIPQQSATDGRAPIYVTVEQRSALQTLLKILPSVMPILQQFNTSSTQPSQQQPQQQPLQQPLQQQSQQQPLQPQYNSFNEQPRHRQPAQPAQPVQQLHQQTPAMAQQPQQSHNGHFNESPARQSLFDIINNAPPPDILGNLRHPQQPTSPQNVENAVPTQTASQPPASPTPQPRANGPRHSMMHLSNLLNPEPRSQPQSQQQIPTPTPVPTTSQPQYSSSSSSFKPHVPTQSVHQQPPVNSYPQPSFSLPSVSSLAASINRATAQSGSKIPQLASNLTPAPSLPQHSPVYRPPTIDSIVNIRQFVPNRFDQKRVGSAIYNTSKGRPPAASSGTAKHRCYRDLALRHLSEFVAKQAIDDPRLVALCVSVDKRGNKSVLPASTVAGVLLENFDAVTGKLEELQGRFFQAARIPSIQEACIREELSLDPVRYHSVVKDALLMVVREFETTYSDYLVNATGDYRDFTERFEEELDKDRNVIAQFINTIPVLGLHTPSHPEAAAIHERLANCIVGIYKIHRLSKPLPGLKDGYIQQFFIDSMELFHLPKDFVDGFGFLCNQPCPFSPSSDLTFAEGIKHINDIAAGINRLFRNSHST
ncbi:hypothetical protein GQ42DRAFT_177320 [Ramicandelaber brevisporus]|nr:hypothetical protein GQ42DRAFT_177320 [Ramicandelaber brevisporus]